MKKKMKKGSENKPGRVNHTRLNGESGTKRSCFCIGILRIRFASSLILRNCGKELKKPQILSKNVLEY